MEYERIREKPAATQGGGLSPRKLRSMLMGAERKRIGEEEIDSTSSLASLAHEGGGLDNCKDVDVVTVEVQRKAADNHPRVSFKVRSNEEGSVEFENVSGGMSVASSVFEFQKSERAAQRAAAAVAPFSKPAPSKWDDAQKWIASPTATRPKVAPVQGGLGGVLRKVSNFGNGSKQLNAEVVLDVSDQKMVACEEPDTKRIDMSHEKEGGEEKYVKWENHSNPAADSYCKSLQMIESNVGQSAINLSCHDSSMSTYGSTTFIPPPSTARAVSMRDMGTEMTPIASQEPSRNGTPVRSTTPTRRPSSPGRTGSAPCSGAQLCDFRNNEELSEKELQMKTRREIMALGKQLGKTNIAAWASKAEEDKDASTSLKIKAEEQAAKSVIDARATAWEEVEKSKCMARFKRDEIRIQAWENHQKAKAEAEMKKTEVEVERMKAHAHDRLTSTLAATRHKAEEKLAKAEAKRNLQVAKAEQQANYIRRTGRTPSSFSCCSWCF